jgi:hypothetical protein
MAVPVALFRSPSRGAVLMHYFGAAIDDPEYASIDTEEVCFRRTADEWEQAGSSGGTTWSDGPDGHLRRPPGLGAREVRFLGWLAGREESWTFVAASGVAGVEAVTVEVEQDGESRQAPIDSPVGAFIAATDGDRPAMVRIRDAAGAILFERPVPDIDGVMWGPG